MKSTHYVYFIREHKVHRNHKGTYAVKIGVSKSPEKRLKVMQTGNPRKLKVAAQLGPFSKAEAYRLERQMHQNFSRWRLVGEWFHDAILRNMHRIAMTAADDYDHDAVMESKRLAREKRQGEAGL